MHDDQISYSTATGPVTVDAAAGRVDADAGNRGHDRVVLEADIGFTGSAYADTMTGGSENDQFDGGAGADHLMGGAGDDSLLDGDASDASGDDDVLDGGAGTDYLEAHGGSDSLDGGDGNDRIFDYGDSADTIHGGDGRDFILDDVVHAPQTLDGGDGRDDVAIEAHYAGKARISIDLEAGTLTVGAGPNGLLSQLAGVEKLFSVDTRGRLIIAGTEDNDAHHLGALYSPSITVYGRGGDDTLYGRGGDDTLYGGPGDDTLDGGPGDDTLDGGPGDDVAFPGGGKDTCVSIEKVYPREYPCEVDQ